MSGLDLRRQEDRERLGVDHIEALSCGGSLRMMYIREGVGNRKLRAVGWLYCDACGAMMPSSVTYD